MKFYLPVIVFSVLAIVLTVGIYWGGAIALSNVAIEAVCTKPGSLSSHPCHGWEIKLKILP
jgi:hypothetical protein